MTPLLLLLIGCGGVQLIQPEEPPVQAAPEARAVPDAVPVQAVVGTSGSGASVVFDGNVDTAWEPQGAPAMEGLLVRFEESIDARRVEITPCSRAERFEVTDYVNGRVNNSGAAVDGATVLELPSGIGMRHWFMRIDAATGPACVAELVFSGEESMAFTAPTRMTATVEASSTLEPEQPYLVDFLFDGRLDFGWVEGADGDGIGEIVTVTLDESVQVAGLQLWNGYQRSPDHFARNARARRLRLSADGGPWTDLDLADASGMQTARLLVPLRGRELRLAIDSSYPGSQYTDLVVSELRFLGRDGPFGIEVSGQTARLRQQLRSLQEQPVAEVLDAPWTSLCDGDEVAASTFKLRSNHSFVWYETQDVTDPETEKTTSRDEVFDGAWVFDKVADGWSELRLYGRRNRTEESWKPYAPVESDEQVRVAGGRVRLARVASLDDSQLRAWLDQWQSGPLARQIACVAQPDPEADPVPLATVRESLVAADALIVTGAAMSDLLVPAKRD